MSDGAKLPAAFLSRLADIVGADDLFTDPADRWPYSYDNSRRQAQPDAVAFPTSHDEVRDCVRLCNEFEIPILARGLGSSTTGSAVPVAGEPDGKYAEVILARVGELSVGREIAAIKAKLQRMNPEEDQAGYGRIFGELIALEQRHRWLLDRAAGA